MKYKNNPFNIRSGSRWLGLSGNKNGFCEFEALEYGVRAAAYLLLKTYRKRGLVSIKQIISTFAPPSENNTARYIQFCLDGMRRDSDNIYLADQPLTCIPDYVILLHYMARFETGMMLSGLCYYDVINKFCLTPKNF